MSAITDRSAAPYYHYDGSTHGDGNKAPQRVHYFDLTKYRESLLYPGDHPI